MAGLVKKLDKVVTQNQDQKLAAVVNVVGDGDELAEKVGRFAETHGITNVAVTVTDAKNAERFNVNSEAAVTVMHYKGKKVQANHAVAPGQLDEKTVEAILADVNAILE